MVEDNENAAAGHVPAHIPALDGLRGIAILLVIPHNADIFSHAAPWLLPFALLAHAGWIGVQLFFVLSGFLITRNLLDSRSAPNYFRVFYGRRALRIFPLYFLTLFAAFVVIPRLVELSPAVLASHRHQIWLWTFLSNWVEPFGVDVAGFSHFWSLAIEEQFYLVWPLVVLTLVDRRLLWACVGLVIVAFVARVVLLQSDVNRDIIYMFTICRMDALALGAAAAVLARSRKWMDWLSRRYRQALAACAVLLISTGLITHTYASLDTRMLSIGYPMLAGAFALLILVVATLRARQPQHWLGRALSMRWLRSVGRYSYAMYVFHLPLIAICGASIRAAFAWSGSALPLWYVLSAIVLSYAAGFVSYHLIEKHFLRLKYLFAPRAPAALRMES